MKLTILGTSNAWGPNPFREPPAPYPMMGELSDRTPVQIRRFRTSLLLQTDEGKRILIDCGPDFVHQLRAFDVGFLDAILLTHPHQDHCAGLYELNLYKYAGRIPIPVYASGACWNSLKTTRGYGSVIAPMQLVTEHHLMPQTESIPQLTIGSVRITPFAVEHNTAAPGSLGFLFEETRENHTTRILYTGDFWRLTEPTAPLFQQQFDWVILECDRWSGEVGPDAGGGHMSFEEIQNLLTSGAFANPQPRQISLVHFGDNGPQGNASTYADWRTSAVNSLRENHLAQVIPNEDWLIGYEGMTLTF